MPDPCDGLGIDAVVHELAQPACVCDHTECCVLGRDHLSCDLDDAVEQVGEEIIQGKM